MKNRIENFYSSFVPRPTRIVSSIDSLSRFFTITHSPGSVHRRSWLTELLVTELSHWPTSASLRVTRWIRWLKIGDGMAVITEFNKRRCFQRDRWSLLSSSWARQKGCDVMKMKKGGRDEGGRSGREGVACKVRSRGVEGKVVNRRRSCWIINVSLASGKSNFRWWAGKFNVTVTSIFGINSSLLVSKHNS